MRILYVAMLAYSILIIFMAEWLTKKRTTVAGPEFLLIILFLAALAGLVSLASSKKARDFQPGFRESESDLVPRLKFVFPLMIGLGAAEAVVLFGFVERFMGATVVQAGILYAVGIVLFLFAAPRELPNP